MYCTKRFFKKVFKIIIAQGLYIIIPFVTYFDAGNPLQEKPFDPGETCKQKLFVDYKLPNEILFHVSVESMASSIELSISAHVMVLLFGNQLKNMAIDEFNM